MSIRKALTRKARQAAVAVKNYLGRVTGLRTEVSDPDTFKV